MNDECAEMASTTIGNKVFDLTGTLPTGTTVLEASAGTGKTYTITALAVRYLAEGLVTLDQVMMVTFSRAATSELRSRFHQRLQHSLEVVGDASLGTVHDDLDEVDSLLSSGTPEELTRRRTLLQSAMDDFDRATIATTHEFCHRMLSGLGLLADHDGSSRFVADIADMADEVVADIHLSDELARGGTSSWAAENRLAAWQQLGWWAAVHEPSCPLVEYAPDTFAGRRVSFARRVREELEHRKRRAGLFTFDDMVLRLRDALADPVTGDQAAHRLSSRYRLVLIDEFQDTDPIQWEIVQKAFVSRSTVVLIGDPKQAIYAFRGADVNAYLDAVRAADQVFTLGTNHRSDKGVVDGVIAVFAETAMGAPEITARPVQARHVEPRLAGPGGHRPALQIRCVPGKDDKELTSPQARTAIENDLVREVVAMLRDPWTVTENGSSRRLAPQDIAVLVRTNKRGQQIRDALDAAGVAAVFPGASTVTSSRAARDWLTLLQALVEPQSSSMKRAALTCLLGWDEQQLAAAVREDCNCAADRTLSALAITIKTLSRVLSTQGITAVLEVLCDQHQLYARLLARPDGERTMTDVRHLAQMMHRAATRSQLGPSGLVAWLSDRIDQASRGEDDDRTRRLETDRSCVQVLTIHAAKGLEFPVVMLPEASHAWLPDDKSDPFVTHVEGQRVLDVGIKGARRERFANHRCEDQAEDLRTLYVAMTRAKSRLVMWWAPTRQNTAGSPLHRLLAGPRRPGATPDGLCPLLPTPVQACSLDPQLVEVVPAPPAKVEALPSSSDHHDLLTARSFTRVIDHTWRRTSYSALTAEAHSVVTIAESSDEPELDDARPFDPIVAPSASAADSRLAPLPGGTHFGTLVHAVLEHVDTSRPDLHEEISTRVHQQLELLPIDGVSPDDLIAGLEQAMLTPLGAIADDLTLSDIAPSDRLAELDFEMPLGSDGCPSCLADIATALQDPYLTGGDDFAERYGRYLAASPVADKTLNGFLTGSIDVVLRLPQGRHLVLDYKTNRIPCDGELTSSHYTRSAMADAMVEAHYPLQAMLYQVALHRFLSWRLPGYAPERHLGGVGYLFVRGMAGATTPMSGDAPWGVFTWRPAPALVQRVSDILAGVGSHDDHCHSEGAAQHDSEGASHEPV